MTLTGKLNLLQKNKDKALKVVQKIAKDRMKYNNKKVDFSGLIDEALLLDYSGEFDEAISVLQTHQSLLDSDDAAYIDELICRVKVDQLVAAGKYNGDITEAVIQCEKCGGNLKSGSTVASTTGSETNNDDLINNQVSLSIVPNPVNGISTIEITLPD